MASAVANSSLTLLGFNATVDKRRTEFEKGVDEKRLCFLCGILPSELIRLPCGHCSCKICFQRGLKYGDANRCPVDKMEFETRLVKVDRTSLEDIPKLRVHCWNNQNGCEFVDALHKIADHYVKCEYFMISCQICGVNMIQKEIGSHFQENGCTYGANELEDSNREALEPDGQYGEKRLFPHSTIGLYDSVLDLYSDRKFGKPIYFENDFMRRLLTFNNIHLKNKFSRLSKRPKVKLPNRQYYDDRFKWKDVQTSKSSFWFMWKVSFILQRLQGSDEVDGFRFIFSESFYTFPGYKLRLCIGKFMTDLCVGIQVQSGGNDTELKWPFALKYSIVLQNQKKETRTIQKVFDPEEETCLLVDMPNASAEENQFHKSSIRCKFFINVKSLIEQKGFRMEDTLNVLFTMIS